LRDTNISLTYSSNGDMKWVEMDPSAREEVVRSLIPKVKIIAQRMKSKLPARVELDDLISAGSVGLLEALANFDPSFGVKLETFVENRIRGAILDELRKQDWVSRGLRRNVKAIDSALRKLEQKLGRDPRIEEVARETGLKEEEVQDGLEILNHNLFVTYEFVQENRDQAREDEDPAELVVKKDLIRRLAGYIEELTEREKLVLSLYYVEELTMREVAEVMEISEGRVSQLHRQAIVKLREKMGKET